ncbi:glucosamine--fructose-6-phosphate aminotransferase (isomerizing) [Sulfobacillus thermosulfidooxidans DSM 9293]|uniref:Glucosamine--fructose-6-phosphate aminotransferase (Isomerizing) n=1 Tax=Sulfobacillus thermosulfidooxidans (strain DSM 9293 / VKM B-1269 / AT-1) TaxID=929705 RepID=A0A1W1WPK8_SULTA|nr:SIS domain-containing protein [Sulfobacillus thermosulfidooxidans]SMC08237.1 glucosamine--fructose-6-phosphate aminotransferase (isomerizing) [Sulfobacillus thermosulfidooxidans DSM 9293]
MRGTQVYHLIQHQAAAWQAALPWAQPLPCSGPYVFSGSGSSYYLAQTAAHYALSLGIEARAVASTDLILEPEIALRGTGCLIIISRSGTTSEALWAMQAAREVAWPVIAVTCHADSPLATHADHLLLSPQGEDATIVMVQSFSSMLFLLQQVLQLTATSALLPETFIAGANDMVQQAAAVIPPLLDGRPPRRLYVLGSGVRYGIAQEGALKAQEMSNQCAMAYAPMEFRHGPWGSLTPDDLIVVLGQTRHRSQEITVVRDLMHRQGRVLVIAQPQWHDSPGRYPTIQLPASGPDRAFGPFAVIPLQYLAWHWTLLVNKDPDHPANITQVVELDHDDFPE